jgi:hypothetical protein
MTVASGQIKLTLIEQVQPTTIKVFCWIRYFVRSFTAEDRGDTLFLQGKRTLFL